MRFERNTADGPIHNLGNLRGWILFGHAFEFINILVGPSLAHRPLQLTLKFRKKWKVPTKPFLRTQVWPDAESVGQKTDNGDRYERSYCPATATRIFCGAGLLLSLSVLILDQYIPGEWF
jgi:hypothetical protein